MKQIDLLNELRSLIENQLAIKIDRIILFGSRATKKYQEYSDYDILIIVKDPFNWKLKNKIYDLCYDLDLKYDLLTDIKIISLIELDTIKGKQPFILNAIENGITV